MEKTLKYGKFIVLIPILLILAFLVFTSFYTVGETERAVITTFGKVTAIKEAGLQFKLPYPIQDVYKVDMTTRKITIGYGETLNSSSYVKEEESKMITGDFNVVSVDFFMEWKVTDPQKYLFNSKDPAGILKNVAQAAARDVMGSKTVDEVLTTGKVAIQSEIKEMMVSRLEMYDIGIQVIEVKIQDAEPPTTEVIAAFKAVETAKQEKETTINVAKAYENSILPEAQAQADKILKEAEAFKEQRVNEAEGEAAKFTAMFNEFINSKEVTKKRMYLETIEDIFPDIEIYIDAGNGSMEKLMIVGEDTNKEAASAVVGG
ncbi:MAG: FtsH protease activity modulator HflK [Ruminococcaceae bacterium]|nr:FtsH protease activity modulator HflK [Oscillospiraceae bacterium]